MPTIHPTAIVDPSAELADDVAIGPWCRVGGEVRLGPGVELVGSVVLEGPVSIGTGARIFPFTCVGLPGQDFKFGPGMATAGVRIGSGCVIREHVPIHAATNDHTPTTIGDACYLMVASHAGHDTRVGDGVILTNNALLGGHAEVGPNAIISGNTAIHQHTRIGRLAMVGGVVGVSADVPPFCLCDSENCVSSLNLVGLRRSGASRDEIDAVRYAFRTVIARSLPRTEAVEKLRELGADQPMVMELADFIASTKRGICHGAKRSTRRH